MKPKVAAVILGAIALLGGMIYLAMPSPAFRVEVCLEFKGQTSCKIASSATEQTALRTATENACALISGGVTDTIACQNTTPKSVKWLKRP